jgi:hypothetical protein
VERAKQERQQKIVQAEGEAEAAKMISFTMQMHFFFYKDGQQLLCILTVKCTV